MDTINTIKVKWTGIRPLIMHNGVGADPANADVRRVKEFTGKRKKTDSDYTEIDRLSWLVSLYWDEKLGPVIPSDNIERCIQLGAQKKRLGKDFAAAFFCSTDQIKLEYDGPRTKEALYADDAFTLRRSVVVNNMRIMRVRPMFPTGWTIKFEAEYDCSVIPSEDAVVTAMRDAGALIGLGDWRPKFGRFLVEVL